MIKRIDFFLITILVILCLFFRLSRLESFQYWSDDDQLMWLTLRHIIVDKHPSLVSVNVATGAGLGPLFHWLSTPWFWINNLNPQKILLAGNLFAVLSTVAIYIAGRMIGGRIIGFNASFLYSVSFISSLFDRRFWVLTPDILLVTIAIISLIKISQGDSRFLYLLVFPIAFAFNSDPTLGIVILASFLFILIIRPKLEKRKITLSFILLLILALPLIIFEIRHSGQNFQGIKRFISEQTSQERKVTLQKPFLIFQFENFSRFFYIRPTNTADIYLCYCEFDDKRPALFAIIVGIFLVLFFIITIKEKKESYLILLLFLFSYIIGIIIFKELFKGSVHFHYSLVISPILFLIVAILLTKRKILLFLTLPILFIINLNTLQKSNFKYPIRDKIAIVKQTISKLPADKNFSLYHSGDVLLASGGWAALFMANGHVPNKGSFSMHWGHVYETYNLYPIRFSSKEPETVVVLSERELEKKGQFRVIDVLQQGQIYSIIYDNSKSWFIPEASLEKLYQPKFF